MNKLASWSVPADRLAKLSHLLFACGILQKIKSCKVASVTHSAHPIRDSANYWATWVDVCRPVILHRPVITVTTEAGHELRWP